jgi:hypothetical protein
VEFFHLANAIDRPVCKQCGIRMMLARVSPDGAGFEVRSFECPKCDRFYSERVATDPMELCKGWLSSELKPPK